MPRFPRYCLLLLVSILLIACDDDEDLTLDAPDFRLLPGTSIRFVESDSLPLRFERVASADSLVLEARIYRDPLPGFIDDEHDLVLNILLSATQTSFSHAGTAIPRAAAFLSYENCFCAGNQPVSITDGQFSGQLLQPNSWRVEGSVTTETGYVFEVGGDYGVR